MLKVTHVVESSVLNILKCPRGEPEPSSKESFQALTSTELISKSEIPTLLIKP